MRILRLAILTVTVSLTCAGIAVAGHIEAGAGAPFESLKGKDSFGKVTLLMNFGHQRAVALTKLRYASECSRTGTVVAGSIRIDRHGHLQRNSGGFLITGAVSARGTTDIVKASVTQLGDCDGDRDAVPFIVRAS